MGRRGIFGTTDVDHGPNLVTDPSISDDEAEYLLDGLQRVFPAQELNFADVNATYSGFRPVVDTGKANPSRESREHVLWDENGLLTVSGGKLTTFRMMARDALKAVRRHLGHFAFDPDIPVLDAIPPDAEKPVLRISPQPNACACWHAMDPNQQAFSPPDAELQPIEGTIYLWAELRQAARTEGVVHLDDLLLRRRPSGIARTQWWTPSMDHIRSIAQPELGWDDPRWQVEERPTQNCGIAPIDYNSATRTLQDYSC